MKKRNKNKKWLWVFAILIIIGILTTFTFTIKDDRKLSAIEKVFKDSSLFIVKIVSSPIDFTNNQINKWSEKKNLYEKYIKLQEENKLLKKYKVDNEELKYQLSEIKNKYDISNILSDYSYLNSTIINRNVGLWYDYITIDSGSKNGVLENMPVVTEEGLVGLTYKVSNFNSNVKLLTSNDNFTKISVKIKNDEEYIYGILSSYNAKEKLFIIEGIDQNINIKEGSLVTTTGLSKTLPSGIRIGVVTKVLKDNFDLSTILHVQSSVDFSNLNYVTILKKEVKND